MSALATGCDSFAWPFLPKSNRKQAGEVSRTLGTGTKACPMFRYVKRVCVVAVYVLFVMAIMRSHIVIKDTSYFNKTAGTCQAVMCQSAPCSRCCGCRDALLVNQCCGTADLDGSFRKQIAILFCKSILSEHRKHAYQQ